MAFVSGALTGIGQGVIKQQEEARETEKEVLKAREDDFRNAIKEYEKRITEEEKTVNGHVNNMNRLIAEYMSLGLSQEDARVAALGNYKNNPNKQYVDTEVSSIQKLKEEGVATPSYILESLQLSEPDPSKPKVTAQQLARQITPETKFDMPYFAARQDTVPGIRRFFGRAEEGEESTRLKAQRASFDRQMQSLMARRQEREDVELSRTVGGRLPPIQKVLSIPQQLEKIELQIKNASSDVEKQLLMEDRRLLLERAAKQKEALSGKGSDDDGRPATENTFANALRGQSVMDYFEGDKTLLKATFNLGDSVENKRMMVKSYAFRNFAAAKQAGRGEEYRNKLMTNMRGGLTTGIYGSLLGRGFFDRLEEDYIIRGGVYTLDEYAYKLRKDEKSSDPDIVIRAKNILEGNNPFQINRLMEAFYIPKEGDNTYTEAQITLFMNALKPEQKQ